ncbi:two component system response regulatory protein [Bifidobacterium adolescentis ATCC 15703]|uniref:Two component system response regulatory protein n=1 Tax=Bifidobacterium adolescentis (strain ATCC 15703 / DSM 20083 / NCTC 11814 / E194a) TaxID=367928 RepID=A1A0G5_BIFAA|nr:two component system response regulatory protein [Bifidobacterium adolescentis ATCC 15703]
MRWYRTVRRSPWSERQPSAVSNAPSSAVMCGLNITKMRPPKSSSTKAMMRLGTPIILAAMPTQPLRCASNVSFRSCATARSSSVFSAAADGWLKNGMDVIISRCM